MSVPRLSGVGARALRVALVTTLIVAAVYVAISVTVVLIVQRGLTAEVDRRLTTSVTRLVDAQQRGQRPPGALREPGGGPRFAAPLLIWTVHQDGSVTGNDANATLPVTARAVRQPQTVTLGDTDVRLAGAASGSNETVVVGQTMAPVAQARSTVVLAEVIVGPILLLTVFLGAVTIGRRVAAPVELARRRQLEFTADASHELRTPLSVIQAQASLALSAERDPGWSRRAFERIDQESRRMHHLVDDLLWLARFDATETRTATQPLELAAAAETAVERFTALAEQRGLQLTLRPAGVPAVVNAAPDWVDRLLGVLIDNACRYSPDGGTVVVAVAVDGNTVRLSVEDSGPGIPPDQRERIFDRFHRASEVPGGAGLGLAIGDAVVRATGGRWEVGTSAAGGAAMAVAWPRRTT